MREEGAVAGEDVWFGCGRGGGGGGVGPGAGVFGCIGGGEGEGTDCDTDIKIGKDELNAYEVSQDGSATLFRGDGMGTHTLAEAVWPMG